MRTHILLAVAAAVLSTTTSHAGGLLGADVRYEHVAGLTWSFSVFTYEDPFAPADAPELFVTFDGGAVDTVPRLSQETISDDCSGQVHLNTYTWQRTFSGPGVYSFNAWKLSRISTVNLPSGPDGNLCLSSTIVITAGMSNSSPVFGAPQRTLYYAGNTLVHDPLASDPDEDSLSFALSWPLGQGCMALNTFTPPDLSTPPGDLVSLNATSGLFQWSQPNTSGEFTVAIVCREWRAGQVIGVVSRDMTICVQAPFTSLSEQAQSEMSIVQTSLDGTVNIRLADYPGSLIDIIDARGAILHHRRPTGPVTTFRTDGMSAGVYIVMVTGAGGAISTGRFGVAR